MVIRAEPLTPVSYEKAGFSRICGSALKVVSGKVRCFSSGFADFPVGLQNAWSRLWPYQKLQTRGLFNPLV